MQLIDNWKLVVLERYAKFDGRAGRAEFWWFVLANFLVMLLLGVLTSIASLFLILYIGYGLAVIVPSIALAIRRLHDSNKTGWFLLLGLIPIVGFIVLLVFYIMEGTPEANQYGVAAEPAVS